MIFKECHPAVNFLFFAGALILGMCFIHPLFLACSVSLSMVYYRIVKKNCLRYIGRMLVLFWLLSVVNPFFNTQGVYILFTYLKGRPYTLEALFYGMALAGMLITVLTWFATYNEIMTSDKFLYCFGKLSPSISLILTMVLRLVPSFQKKCEQIAGARKCIGKSVETGTAYEKAEHGLTIVSALTSWALEGGVVMADSMRSRGFGTGKRTAFSIYQMRNQDRNLMIFMLLLLAVTVVCAGKGGMSAAYTPDFYVAGVDSVWTVLGGISYFAFLAVPTIQSVKEALIWRILRSGI